MLQQECSDVMVMRMSAGFDLLIRESRRIESFSSFLFCLYLIASMSFIIIGLICVNQKITCKPTQNHGVIGHLLTVCVCNHTKMFVSYRNIQRDLYQKQTIISNNLPELP